MKIGIEPNKKKSNFHKKAGDTIQGYVCCTSITLRAYPFGIICSTSHVLQMTRRADNPEWVSSKSNTGAGDIALNSVSRFFGVFHFFFSLLRSLSIFVPESASLEMGFVYVSLFSLSMSSRCRYFVSLKLRSV